MILTPGAVRRGAGRRLAETKPLTTVSKFPPIFIDNPINVRYAGGMIHTPGYYALIDARDKQWMDWLEANPETRAYYNQLYYNQLALNQEWD